jgi:hypothetical protein
MSEENTLLLLHEISERLRGLESKIIGVKNMAAIENLKGKVEQLFDRVEARYSSFLPFSGKYLKEFRAVILANLDRLKANWEQFNEDGDARKLIDLLMVFARGNLRLPWWLAPFQGAFLDGLHTWLLRNQDVFRDSIGSEAPRL